jgi:two-component system, NarL family, invasion response regulator UvrY
VADYLADVPRIKDLNQSGNEIRILIADDHNLIREGLKKILKNASDLTVVGEAQNAEEVLEQLKSSRVDIVVLDLSFPGSSGLEILNDLKQGYPKLPVLILSMHPEERFAIRAFKAGASGYLTKNTATEELIYAIRRVVGGRKFVSASLTEKLAMQLETAGEAKSTGSLAAALLPS